MQELTLEQMVQRIHVLTMDSNVSRKLGADRAGLETIANIMLKHQYGEKCSITYDATKEKFLIVE